ncbi:unnamed protein product [Candidula unifasciata]|uniref:Glycoprotein-N-acetylgalactosamine 3-beta-galactosyltransferase 1 n=1 Tax=Candidula unifasciata TaxID=100452 RepID=A0A8S3ZKR2_9EUPU|nr:unnamed protein product [Candidula unifasciata]
MKLQFMHGLIIGLIISYIAFSLNSHILNWFIQWTIPYNSNVENTSEQGSASFRSMDDNHVHNDDDSVAQKLQQKVRVLVAVMTATANLQTKAQVVKDTWARHCSKIIFFSTKENKAFPTVRLNVREGRDHLTAKTMAGFDYMYEHHYNDFDWFMKADDDTYVIMENLRYFLSSQNFREPVFFGHHFVQFVKQGYNSGGAGYVLSKEAIRRISQRGNNSKCNEDGKYEDIDIGRCLENLGVRLANSTDALGRNRFHVFTPSTHLKGQYPKWFYRYDARGGAKGIESMSDYSISFHHITPKQMMEFEFFIYHVRPYGIYNGEQKLNIKNNKIDQK